MYSQLLGVTQRHARHFATGVQTNVVVRANINCATYGRIHDPDMRTHAGSQTRFEKLRLIEEARKATCD